MSHSCWAGAHGRVICCKNVPPAPFLVKVISSPPPPPHPPLWWRRPLWWRSLFWHSPLHPSMELPGARMVWLAQSCNSPLRRRAHPHPTPPPEFGAGLCLCSSLVLYRFYGVLFLPCVRRFVVTIRQRWIFTCMVLMALAPVSVWVCVVPRVCCSLCTL